MAKLTMYFKNQAEVDAYFGAGQPIPSKFLVIIEEMELPSGEIVTNSAITSTNNIDQGVVENVGVSAMSYSYSMSYAYVYVEKDLTELETSYATAYSISEDVLLGE